MFDFYKFIRDNIKNLLDILHSPVKKKNIQYILSHLIPRQKVQLVFC